MGIETFKLFGLEPSSEGGRFFADSNISASLIGTVALLNVDFDNEGNAFGIWARDGGPGSEIKSVKWADSANNALSGNWPSAPDSVYDLRDLNIRML